MKRILLAVMMMAMPMAAAAETVHVSVNGLVCAFCAQGIENSFMKKDEVSKVDVNLDDKLVTVELREGQQLSDEEINTTLTDSGYTVTNIHRK